MPVGPDAALGVPCEVWLAEDSQSQGSRLKSGYPMVETRPALLSANSPTAALLTEKG